MTRQGEITKFIEMVKLNEADFNDAIGFSHKLPMTLSLQVKGKRLIIPLTPIPYHSWRLSVRKYWQRFQKHGLFNQARFEPNGYNTSDSRTDMAVHPKCYCTSLKPIPSSITMWQER